MRQDRERKADQDSQPGRQRRHPDATPEHQSYPSFAELRDRVAAQDCPEQRAQRADHESQRDQGDEALEDGGAAKQRGHEGLLNEELLELLLHRVELFGGGLPVNGENFVVAEGQGELLG